MSVVEAVDVAGVLRDRPDSFSGGARLLPIETPWGPFRVWVKRTGSNDRVRLLLLHGGPGWTHEYFEVFDSYLPQAGVEYYYYDQLGSQRSDRPDRSELWEPARFVDEIEQVRRALGLDASNFFLLGHSWGGILAIEYALRYQRHLKGLIISNMMSSIPAYKQYAEDVLMPQVPPAVLAEVQAIEATGNYDKPRYMELLVPHHYERHVLRRPYAHWPDPVLRTLAHVNMDIYVGMQGPSELGTSGRLEQWNRAADLCEIKVPTLVIGAAHDTMDPAHMALMADALPRGEYLNCSNGSHLAMYDDQTTYVSGLLRFLGTVGGA